jgi:4-diphosphocytidyl-2-C-methyl-D-erythritol kinase
VTPALPVIPSILRADAPAKINRELRVGPLRADGYHEIRSRIVSIDLADTIEVASADELHFSSSGIPVPADDSNLVVRAARALAERIGRRPDARIHLTKRVPVASGLGGGSSDAARTLVLLSELWGSELSPDELAAIGASLGSDVPFFFVGGEADVSGRGEVVAPIREPARPSEDLLLVFPPFGTSTSEAYARVGDPRSPLPDALEIETSGKFFGPNELAFAVLQERLDMAVLLDFARALASEAAVTGSGSTIVLKGASSDAAARLTETHPEARLQRGRTLAREEYALRTESSGGSEWTSLKSKSFP